MSALLERIHTSWAALADHMGYTPAMVALDKEVRAALAATPAVAEPAPATTEELPPLPEPVVVGSWSGHTPNQMRAYARAALANRALPTAEPGRYTQGYEAGMGSCIPRLNALLEENSRLKSALLDCNLATAALAKPAATTTEQRDSRPVVPAAAQLAELLRQECDDTDAVFLHALGLEPSAYRTEGGRLNLAKLRAAFGRPGMDGFVDNFMTWRLPEDFAPDGGVSFDGRHDASGRPLQWPLGTNLLTEPQARAMLEEVLVGRVEALAPDPVAFKAVLPNGSWSVLVLDTAAWEKLPHGTKLWLSSKGE